MIGLKMIPAFFILMVMTYFGIQFVEANRDEVYVTVASWQSRPVALGFVVITSFFIGMVFTAALSLAEVLRLHVVNHRLRRKVSDLQSFTQTPSTPNPSDLTTTKASGRFS